MPETTTIKPQTALRQLGRLLRILINSVRSRIAWLLRVNEGRKLEVYSEIWRLSRLASD